MQCRIYPLGSLKQYQFVVILSQYHGFMMLSRHQMRTTWETQGGHIETGETPLAAAERELYEESGAVKYVITPAFDYSVEDGKACSFGMAFTAVIEELAALPESKMAEVAFFDRLPDALTYPDITPKLFAQVDFIKQDILSAAAESGVD